MRRLNELGISTSKKYKHSKGLMLKNPKLDKHDGIWSMNTICTILKN
ncbi:hypothetical protein ACV3P8_15275 [Clostridium perfringens]